MATTVAIFFVRILPANKATSDWTELDEDWRTLRRRWERGHAVNALITFAAPLVAVAAALAWSPVPHGL